MSLCLELEISNLHLEGDAKEIVQAMLMHVPCRTRYGHLIEAIRTSLSSIQDWSISYV